jgi:hypothetical protein
LNLDVSGGDGVGWVGDILRGCSKNLHGNSGEDKAGFVGGVNSLNVDRPLANSALMGDPEAESALLELVPLDRIDGSNHGEVGELRESAKALSDQALGTGGTDKILRLHLPDVISKIVGDLGLSGLGGFIGGSREGD